jgi:hypothetical protein
VPLSGGPLAVALRDVSGYQATVSPGKTEYRNVVEPLRRGMTRSERRDLRELASLMLHAARRRTAEPGWDFDRAPAASGLESDFRSPAASGSERDLSIVRAQRLTHRPCGGSLRHFTRTRSRLRAETAR